MRHFSVSMVQIIGLTVGSNGRWLPKICSMTLVWTLDIPNAGAGCMFSIEDRIWDGQRASSSDTVGRMLFRSQGALRWVRARGVGFGDDVKAPPPERYFWVQNAPYSLNDPDNLLKLQQMRPPSERTRSPRLALKSLRFFSDVTRECSTPFPRGVRTLFCSAAA